MFVTVSRDGGAPIFYHPADVSAKKELRAHVVEVLGKLLGEEEAPPPPILTFNYSLDAFGNAIVARFADSDSRSIEIIEISTKEAGYVWSTVRTVKTLERFDLVRVPTYDGYRGGDGAAIEFGSFDKVIRELKTRIDQVVIK